MNTFEQLVESWRAEFQAAHRRDQRNAAAQPFDEYWRWVKVFFISGGAGHSGWLDQIEVVLRGVRDDAARERLRQRLRELGKTIAAEWSKESRYRRIYSIGFQGTPNLQDWGRRLQRAAGRDSGDGAEIEATLATIEREASAV